MHQAVKAYEELRVAWWAVIDTWPSAVRIPLLIVFVPIALFAMLLIVLTPIALFARMCSALNDRWGLWAAVPAGFAAMMVLGWPIQVVKEANEFAAIERFEGRQ